MASSTQQAVEAPAPSAHVRPFGVHHFPDDRAEPQYRHRTVYEAWSHDHRCIAACSIDNALVGALTEAALWLLLDRALLVLS